MYIYLTSCLSSFVWTCVHIYMYIYLYIYINIHMYRLIYIYIFIVSSFMYTKNVFTYLKSPLLLLLILLQGDEEACTALSCRSCSAKEPQIIGLFCGKRPIKIRHPLPFRHPVCIRLSPSNPFLFHVYMSYTAMGWLRLVATTDSLKL